MSRAPGLNYIQRAVVPGVDIQTVLTDRNANLLWVVAVYIHDHDFGFDSGFPTGNAEHDDPYWCRADDVVAGLMGNGYINPDPE